jgi:hypothetical protein
VIRPERLILHPAFSKSQSRLTAKFRSAKMCESCMHPVARSNRGVLGTTPYICPICRLYGHVDRSKHRHFGCRPSGDLFL